MKHYLFILTVVNKRVGYDIYAKTQEAADTRMRQIISRDFQAAPLHPSWSYTCVVLDEGITSTNACPSLPVA